MLPSLQRIGPVPASAPDDRAERARIAQLAQEFEASLLLQMIRQMRHSMLDEDEREEGFGGATLGDTFDLEWARQLAAQGGLGLARVLAEGIEKTLPAGKAGAGAPTPALDLTPGSTAPLAPAPASLARVRGGGRSVEAYAPAAGAARTPTSTIEAGSSPTPDLTPVGAVGMLPPGSLPEVRLVDAEGESVATSLAEPLDARFSSTFGWRRDPIHGGRRFHRGIDIAAAYGREVPAAAPGRVVAAGEQGGYGLAVVVEHAGGVRTRYAHLSGVSVKPGDEVGAGETLGRVGKSGRATGTHLHFEVIVDGERVDPQRVAFRLPDELKPEGSVVDLVAVGIPATNGVTGADDEN